MKSRPNEKTGLGKAPVVRSSAPVPPTGKVPEAVDSYSPESKYPPAGLNSRWTVLGVCIFLAAVIWAIFGQTLHYEFVNLDDDKYVTENPVVQNGLTWAGFRWALTYGEIGHWHPLTWLSHMLDCQLYGLNPAGHHFTNVLLHTAAAILLFLMLRQMTGFLWRSAFVAAVFAIHPLRVESVAWVAERKDVLSAVFFMLTLGAYVRYVRHPRSMVRYGAVALYFALGLLSKNMLVTLPFVLLLLDYWPLNRFAGFSPWVLLRLVAEKIPLFVLAAGSCTATFLVPEKLFGQLPSGLRFENAVVSYIIYLWQMISPSGLACVYPNPVNLLPLWQVAGALALLLAISGTAWAFHKQHPWLVVGWLWYLGMMVPVIGIVQISYYAHADRYTYLPQIGLYLSLTWAAVELCAGWRHRRVVLGGLAAAILVALICCAHTQVSYWRNSETLWTHTLACTSKNYVGQINLGNALLKKGDVDGAINRYQAVLQFQPSNADAHYNLGNALLRKGQVDAAITHYQMALQSDPGHVQAHVNLGNVLLTLGRVDEAIHHYQKALQIKPDNLEAHNNLGNALFQKGNTDEAITEYREVLQIKSDYLDTRINLGNALLQKGQVDAAITQYQAALRINSNSVDARVNLGNVLFWMGRLDEAISQYETALQINPDRVDAHLNLGNAMLRKGRVDEMIAHYQKALQITPDDPEIQKDLAWVLATCPQASLRNGSRAVALAQRASQLTGEKNPLYLRNLAAAYAEAGRFPEAVQTAQRALQLAETNSSTALADAIRSQMKLYQAGVPYHLH